MQIQVNTDHNVKGGDLLIQYVKGLLNDSLSSFMDEVTRVEVHISDENGHKGGDDDLRCTMEARIRGMQPIAVTHHDENILPIHCNARPSSFRCLRSHHRRQ